MNTLSNIIEIIRQNQTPYLQLYTRDSLRTSKAGTFKCETCDQDTDKVEAAVAWLTSYIKFFPENTVFVIEARKSVTGNQAGVVGPFSFVINNARETTPATQQQNQLAGLNPTAIQQLGYVPSAEIDKQRALLELKYERQLMQQQFENLQQQYKQNLELIQQTHNAWTPKAVAEILQQTALLFGMAKGKPSQALAGTPETQQNEQKNNLFRKKIITELDQLDNKQLAVVLKIIEKTKNANDTQNTDNTQNTDERS